MIVPMKKLTVLVLDTDRDVALARLSDIGAVHLAAVRPTECEDVETARQEFAHLQRALEALPAGAPAAAPSGQTPDEVVREMWRIIQERKTLADEREGLLHERQVAEPFGDFDPAAARALGKSGVTVRLLQGSPSLPLAAPGGAVLAELSRTKSEVFYALIARGEPPRLPAQEVRLPERSLAQMDARLAAIEARLGELQAVAGRHAGDRPQVLRRVADAEDRVRLAEARAGMGAATERILYLRGFCPADRLAALQAAARDAGWGLVDEEPGEDDPVPTLIRPPRWARPIETLMEFIGIMPGYREVDTSVAFLFFFSLFFAMLVGDAGYGALFLAASLWGRRKFPRAPRKTFAFLEIMSGATILWGGITGVFFGIHPAGWPLTLPWLESEENIKRLCFIIGVTHLSLAHIWNMVRFGWSLPSLAQLGWLGSTWTMFFFANTMVLGDPFPRAMIPVVIGSIVLIVLFMTPFRRLKAEWFNHAMLPLNLVSNFVDVVSYIRLFAVGTASFAIAESFNTMLTPMFGSWWTGLFAALFLFLAHALNIVLGLMGVMVHGVRLNTLEFAGHVGLQWSGIPYQPLRRSARTEEPKP